MKKLNRKGFTLVELLAVIIILAVVVGITIPAIITTTDKAKAKAFQSAADTAADWIDRQYSVALINDTTIATVDANFKTQCYTSGALTTICSKGTAIKDAAFIQSAGLKPSNVESISVKINTSTGRSCVTLTAKAGGDYEGAGTTGTNNNQVTGGVC